MKVVAVNGSARRGGNTAVLIEAANFLLRFGNADFISSTGIYLSGIVVLILLYKFVISREEAYLMAVFGDDYRDYCRRVRRWI